MNRGQQIVKTYQNIVEMNEKLKYKVTSVYIKEGYNIYATVKTQHNTIITDMGLFAGVLEDIEYTEKLYKLLKNTYK